MTKNETRDLFNLVGLLAAIREAEPMTRELVEVRRDLEQKVAKLIKEKIIDV